MNPPPDPIEDARHAGFDIDLIESNLALSPEERLRQHDLALQMVPDLQNPHTIHDLNSDGLLPRLSHSGLEFVIVGEIAALAYG